MSDSCIHAAPFLLFHLHPYCSRLHGQRFTCNYVCQLLGISKRTLQHYRDTRVLPFVQIGHKCYYKRENVERLLCVKSDKTAYTTKR